MSRPRVSPAHLARELHLLLLAGASLPDALGQLAGRAEAAWKAGLEKAHQVAVRGGSLGEALAAAGFPEPLLSGVQRCDQPSSLGKLARLQEQRELREQRIRMTLGYPFFLLVALLGLSWLVLGFLGGQLSGLFADLSIRLPSSTLLVLQLSHIVRSGWFIGLEVLMVGALSLVLSGRLLPSLRLRLPLIGSALRRCYEVAWVEWLAFELQRGTSLAEALERAAQFSSEQAFRAQALALAEGEKQGQNLSSALQHHPLLSGLALELIEVGLQQEFPPGYLDQAAELLRSEDEERFEAQMATLEVAGTLMIALLIPPVAASFLFPLYQLLGNLGT